MNIKIINFFYPYFFISKIINKIILFFFTVKETNASFFSRRRLNNFKIVFFLLFFFFFENPFLRFRNIHRYPHTFSHFLINEFSIFSIVILISIFVCENVWLRLTLQFEKKKEQRSKPKEKKIRKNKEKRETRFFSPAHWFPIKFRDWDKKLFILPFFKFKKFNNWWKVKLNFS